MVFGWSKKEKAAKRFVEQVESQKANLGLTSAERNVIMIALKEVTISPDNTIKQSIIDYLWYVVEHGSATFPVPTLAEQDKKNIMAQAAKKLADLKDN
jgi:hypothetical protein